MENKIRKKIMDCPDRFFAAGTAFSGIASFYERSSHHSRSSLQEGFSEQKEAFHGHSGENHGPAAQY